MRCICRRVMGPRRPHGLIRSFALHHCNESYGGMSLPDAFHVAYRMNTVKSSLLGMRYRRLLRLDMPLLF